MLVVAVVVLLVLLEVPTVEDLQLTEVGLELLLMVRMSQLILVVMEQ
jgi:hypothetical protein